MVERLGAVRHPDDESGRPDGGQESGAFSHATALAGGSRYPPRMDAGHEPAGAPHVAREMTISGTVQGVGFRWYTRERARELGVVGWVENLADGRVQAWIEGPEPAVAELSQWLEHGPPSAKVTGVEAQERAAQGHERFRVRR